MLHGCNIRPKRVKAPEKKQLISLLFFFCRLLNQRQLRIRSRRLRRPVARSQRRSGQRERTAISSTMPSSSTSRRMTSSWRRWSATSWSLRPLCPSVWRFEALWPELPSRSWPKRVRGLIKIRQRKVIVNLKWAKYNDYNFDALKATSYHSLWLFMLNLEMLLFFKSHGVIILFFSGTYAGKIEFS